MQAWLFFDHTVPTAVLVTEIVEWPNMKAVNAIIVAGKNMTTWVENMDALLMAFARHHHCSHVTAYGRRGWQNTLRSLGWKDNTVTYVKEV